MIAGEAAPGDEDNPELRTLADKLNWLIEHAHPAGPGPLNEVPWIKRSQAWRR